MGLWAAIKNRNTDLLFVSQEDIDTQTQVNTAQQANLRRQQEEKIISQEEFAASLKGSQENTFEKAFAEPGNSPSDAFSDSVKENFDKLTTGVRNTIGGVIKFAGGTLFKILPWWLWAILAVGVVIYFRVQLMPFLAIAKRLKK